jgi:hypothetical protein
MNREQQIEWCRQQQAEALVHLAPGHKCDHPQCTPANNRAWGNEALLEECILLLSEDAV